MHKHIIQSSVTSQTTHNSTQYTIVNAIMSTKPTLNTPQTSIVKCPIQAISVQITLENSIRCTSERIENSPRPSLTHIATQCRPGSLEGSVLQTSRRRCSGRVSMLNTPSKSGRRWRRKRSICWVFILQNRKLCSCHDPFQSRSWILRRQSRLW